MQKLHVLFIDQGLSMQEVRNHLIEKLTIKPFDFRKSIQEEFKHNSLIAKEMLVLLNQGKLLTIKIMERFLLKVFEEAEEDLY